MLSFIKDVHRELDQMRTPVDGWVVVTGLVDIHMLVPLTSLFQYVLQVFCPFCEPVKILNSYAETLYKSLYSIL